MAKIQKHIIRMPSGQEVSYTVVDDSEDYERIGECKRCGWCCSPREVAKALYEKNEPPKELKFDIALIVASAPQWCPHLAWDRTGLIPKATCVVNNNKPKWCRDFPIHADTPPKTCGYSFKRKKK